MDSKAKGKRFELECCQVLSEVLGTPVERTGQYSAKGGTADLRVPAMPWMHWEAKKRGQPIVPADLSGFYAQAVRDAASLPSTLPLVACRWDRSEYLMVCLWALDLPRLVDLLAPSRGWVRP